ncbi:putative colanic acid biosynthesis UDP-glucose lipid carrier transferase [Flavobacterium sp. PL11]|uniref:exopolysaccharide biosynthesis polyprenyl glycosylphosphotransferase n=1 Tax=Flavobacterium sp. PL11 TaxID=3071717 RepID=UPI002E097BFB|nr:putative colanic acid biosynthesis UDP-glucose lipid carrier transferase [Flavobacterium sp. PL11]
MKIRAGRYSAYIRPFSYIIDLIIINALSIFIVGFHQSQILYAIFISISWFIIAVYFGFYEVYRYTRVITILNNTLKQTVLFGIVCLALELYFSEYVYQQKIVLYVLVATSLVLLFKLFIYYFLRRFRVLYGGNSRTVVLLGNDNNIEPLKHFFTDNPDYGYKLIKVFDVKDDKKVSIKECLSFVADKKIDEIYCAMADLSDSLLVDIIDFADNNLKTVKFIPDGKQVLSSTIKFEFYDYIPIISLRNILQEESFNKVIKRVFDLVFSSIIIISILSWLVPIMAIIIKLDSNGPLFFIQKRNGLNFKDFNCYKFRSMKLNDTADMELTFKNDTRITKIGKFIRKTSIDELPQFFNVFFGEMSVVGPRPHMVSVTTIYAAKVDKFMVRHFVKPGITGLAQTKGFRGEVETDEDIINRVKYDIFYIENWSLLLDVKIIIVTIYNTLRGDDKAY